MIRLPALGAFPSPPPTWTTCRSFIGHSFLTWASCTSLKISDVTCLSARLHQGGAGLILILCLLKCRLPGEVSPEPSFPHTVPASFCPYSCQPHTHYIGEGNGSFSNPLQYSCLENPRDRGAWWAAVCEVAQSRTRLKRLSSSSSTLYNFLMYYVRYLLSPPVSLELRTSRCTDWI